MTEGNSRLFLLYCSFNKFVDISVTTHSIDSIVHLFLVFYLKSGCTDSIIPVSIYVFKVILEHDQYRYRR